MEKKLYRSSDDKVVFGVCGGIAKYFGIDPVLIRIAAVLLIFAGGSGLLAYIVLAIIIPSDDSAAKNPSDVVKENVEEIKNTAERLGEDISRKFDDEEKRKPAAGAAVSSKTNNRSGYFIAAILIFLGALFLLNNLNVLNVFWWMQWHYLWPLVLVGIGLLIIFTAKRK